MQRTLREWEKLWRECWDINDYADLDQVFAGTETHRDVVCEAELLLETREGRIDTVEITLLDEEDFTVLVHHRYTILELGRVELVVELIASINTDPEDEEGGEAEPLPDRTS